MKRNSFILIIFSLMSFVSVMAAFVFGGILDQVAISLGISIANSGLLNTMYSYGAAFGPPITLIVFRKIERSKMLKITLLITIIMTFALVFAQNFFQLLIIRLIMGITANSYGVLAVATVVSLAPRDKIGRAMSLLIMGGSLALVVGIPLTRLLSSILDWRSIFWILNGLMIISFVTFLMFIHKSDHEDTKIELKNEFQFFKDPSTMIVVLYTFVMFIGYNAFYIYVTPYLIALFPSIESSMSIVLLFFGIASFIGNLIGGYVADRIGFRKAMMIGALLQVILITVMFIFQQRMWMTLILVFVWMTSSWFIGLQVNTGIAQVTQNRSSFMISINSSALQLGGAIGSSISAVIIEQTDIKNIIYITLITGIGITMIQFYALKQKNDKKGALL